MTNTVNKNDFIELKYTGYANGKIFDSNIDKDIKQIDPNARPIKTIIAVGQEMVLKGLDKALLKKEIGEQYEITLSQDEAFGERKKELLKTIPLKAFTDKKVTPAPGMVLNLDNVMARIITVSGARVITDFNNPLAGKVINYKFTILRKVTDEKEKVTALFQAFFKFIPEFEIKENIIIKGPKAIEQFIKMYNEKFKELLKKEIEFQETVPENLEKN
jgi:FKBP-type peptidyl-prolyl cis-trans isomerase SlyD